MMVDP